MPKYAEEGISVKSAMESFDYCGIKLHPFGQKWDFENPIHRKCLEEIFAWCDEKNSRPSLEMTLILMNMHF